MDAERGTGYNSLDADRLVEACMQRLILASGSPRRRELLTRIGIPFEIVVSGFHESQDGHRQAEPFARAMSLEKAREVARKLCDATVSGVPADGDGFIVLAADTVVARQGNLLGKPLDREDAARMLRLLSGGWHEVITGMTLLRTDTGEERTTAEITRVRFRPLDEAMVQRYLETGEAFDKAGAYGVQGYGSLLVERMDGDYYNVMGLPLHRLSRMLEDMGVAPYVWLGTDKQ